MVFFFVDVVPLSVAVREPLHGHGLGQRRHIPELVILSIRLEKKIVWSRGIEN